MYEKKKEKKKREADAGNKRSKSIFRRCFYIFLIFFKLNNRSI